MLLLSALGIITAYLLIGICFACLLYHYQMTIFVPDFCGRIDESDAVAAIFIYPMFLATAIIKIIIVWPFVWLLQKIGTR